MLQYPSTSGRNSAMAIRAATTTFPTAFEESNTYSPQPACDHKGRTDNTIELQTWKGILWQTDSAVIEQFLDLQAFTEQPRQNIEYCDSLAEATESIINGVPTSK